MKQTILAISGRPGLYKLVSRGNKNLIVEALDATHRRGPAFATDRITSLGDIAMFTDDEDVPLTDVLESLKTLEQGKKASIDVKKAGGDELREYFAKVLPTFDRERVHNSDIKKLLQWYNILIENGITDFKEEEAAETGEQAPAKETQAKEASVKEAPAEETPVEEAPAKETQAKEASVKEAPAKKAPAKKAAAKKKAE